MGVKPTEEFTDREYLRTHQYRDGRNIRSRAFLHERFSTNTAGWHPWVYSQFDLPSTATIMEVGCGPGFLWSQNSERVPRASRVILSDLSPGMVDEARRELRPQKNFTYLSLDVQHIPLPSARLDAVIANHMLYHVPAVDQAVAELSRILKPGGKLYATTNGESHLQEMVEYVGLASGDPLQEFDSAFRRSIDNFSLESGRKKLRGAFGRVETRRYGDSLRVTDAEAIVQFIRSSSVFQLSERGLVRLREFLKGEIASSGAVHIKKDSGIFIATKTDGS